jgi:hypothetical protein
MNYREVKNIVLSAENMDSGYRVLVFDNGELYSGLEFSHPPCYSHVGIIHIHVRRLARPSLELEAL